jgi:hypothetical protein
MNEKVEQRAPLSVEALRAESYSAAERQYRYFIARKIFDG